MKFINKKLFLKYLPASAAPARMTRVSVSGGLKALRAGLPQIIAMLFLAGFVAYAWTEPGSAPPGGNADKPINVGTTAQTKQGNLILGGILKVEGNLLDGLGNVIYNVLTGKIERARLPFEQGDITSDVDTNTDDSGYYNVANLTPGNVKKSVVFGRSQIGTSEVLLPGETGAYGSVGVYTGIGINGFCDFNNDCFGPWIGVHFDDVSGFGEYDPRDIFNMTISGTAGCWVGFPGNCNFIWINPRPSFSCAPNWTFIGGRPFGGTCFPQTQCGYCRLNP